MISVSDNKVVFSKRLWSEEELYTAECLGMSYDTDKAQVIADIHCTAPLAVHEFAKLSLRVFMEAPEFASQRDEAMAHLRDAYRVYYHSLQTLFSEKVPYMERMYKHQKVGMQEGYGREFTLYAFEQGLGKTITAASLSRICQDKCTVIICPNVVKYNWLRDLSDNFEYDPMNFTILDSAQTRTIRAFLYERFIIVNYEAVGKYMDYIISKKPTHIIIDECTKIKNTNTALYKNVKKLKDSLTEKIRWSLLSGTPIKNRVNDMFAYLKLANHPLGKNYSQFVKNYTHSSLARGGLKIKGGKNLDELYIKLSNFMIRKTKEECLDLPEKVITKCYFELGDYKKEYNEVLRELASQKSIANIQSALHTLNIVVAKSKIPGVIELIEGLLENDRKVVLFSGYNEPLQMLQDYFKQRCIKITGSVPANKRDELIQRFLNDDTCTVFLGNRQAAGIGINLVNSSDCIQLDFPFTSSELDQSVDRLHRIGQKNAVNVYLTIARESIDEQLLSLVTDKKRDINNLINKGVEGDEGYENIPEAVFKELLEKVRNELSIPVQSAE